MSELDEAWDLALADAARRARSAGHRDIADYVALRKQNDLLRRTAVEWLVTTLTALAAKANRAGAGIQIEEKDIHKFRVKNSTMVGSQMTLRHGVRALMIETGWPRTPRDGIVRGGGLACANFKHFGRPRANAELLLVHSKNDVPQWFVIERDGARSALTEAQIGEHFSILLHES
jgi:hypothetical protein